MPAVKGTGQPPSAAPSMWAVVIDSSELNPPPGAALTLICKGCGRFFHCDWEERWCGDCVERREVLGLPMLPAT